MKSETIYKCPVCQSSRNSMQEAIACRNRHQPEQERWAYCEICGAGWNGDHFGMDVAAQRARECEHLHHENGETESLGTWTYFRTGGRHGKYLHPKDLNYGRPSDADSKDSSEECEVGS